MNTISAFVVALSLVVGGAGCVGETAGGEEDDSTSDALKVAGTFLTYNICGADKNCKVADPTAAVISNVVKYHPTAFALQEVCQGQADKISRELRARNIHYVQRFQNAAPHKWNIDCGGLQGWGNAVFHIGDQLGTFEEHAYRSQGGIFRAQNRGYVCVRVPHPDFWACSTHIDTSVSQQKPQLDELKSDLAALASRGGKQVPIVIGGDFNAVPSSSGMNAMFAPSYSQGSGSLLEHDVLPGRTSSAQAATEGGHKIDYVFHSASITVTASHVIPATSDHKLLLNSLLFPTN